MPPSCRMAGAKHFRELVCWQLAQELKLAIYKLIESPTIKRDLRFCDQIREAARSGPRNIAEGFGRRTHREFAMFLDVARGSLMECQNHLQDARRSWISFACRIHVAELPSAEDVRCGSAITALSAQKLRDAPSHPRTLAPSDAPSHPRTVAPSHRAKARLQHLLGSPPGTLRYF